MPDRPDGSPDRYVCGCGAPVSMMGSSHDCDFKRQQNARVVNCPTCNLPQDEHSEEMRANCAVFILSTDADTERRTVSEVETAPDRGEAPPTLPRSGASISLDAPTPDEARELDEEDRNRDFVPRGISVASVLLGWCNDIKRELEEFADDGPVGPMVPYRADADTRPEDLSALYRSLAVLIKGLYAMREDVAQAWETMRIEARS